MPQLPFVVAPRQQTRIVEAQVNGETCSLEFPVYGAITSGEELDIRDHEYQAAVYRESSCLADALVAEGSEETEAQRIAIRILSTRMGIPVPLDAAEQRVMLRHAGLIAELQTTLASEYQRQIQRTVTAAIVHRLPGCTDWTLADTNGLPGPLQAAIAAFIDSERNAGQPVKTAEELIDGMVETLGKLAPPASPDTPEPSPGSSSPSQSTGQLSIGDAGDSGPLPQSSAASASDPSPPATSSRRSRKASAG